MSENARLILEEARGLGLSIEIISEKKEVFVLSYKGKRILFEELFCLALDPLSEVYHFSKDKVVTYALWEHEGIPFPPLHDFKNIEDLHEKINSLQFEYPVLLKPAKGSRSVDIQPDIFFQEELLKKARVYQNGFLVQKMVTGKEYRLLMYGDRVLGCLQMIPPRIEGNGFDTIARLIEKKSRSLQKEIKITPAVLDTLKKQGLSPESIPEKGVVVPLQRNSRLAEGGTSLDCTDLVHPAIRVLAAKAVRTVNLRLGGIDLICDDISLPPEEQSVHFLEVNTYPDLSIHYFPTEGASRPVARMILQDIFQL